MQSYLLAFVYFTSLFYFASFCIPALSSPPHNFVEVPAVPGTCASEGSEAGFQCSVCHKLFDKDYKEVDKLPSSGFDSNNHNYQASWKWDDVEVKLNATDLTNLDPATGSAEITVACANGCGATITRTVKPTVVANSLVTANCVLGRNAEEDLVAEIIIDDVKYTDTYHVVVPFKHQSVWYYRTLQPDGTYQDNGTTQSYTTTQHREYCSRCGEMVGPWENHDILSFVKEKEDGNDHSFVAECACGLKYSSSTLGKALITAKNNKISRVIIDKEYICSQSASDIVVPDGVTLVFEKPLTMNDGLYAIVTVNEGGHIDVNTVVGENVIVKDENTKTVEAKVNTAAALEHALKSAEFTDAEKAEGWVVNVTVDEATAGGAIGITSSEETITVSEGVTLNLTAGDLAEGSKSEYVKVDNSKTRIVNNGTLNVTGIELTRGLATGSVDDKEETTAVLNVVNSKLNTTAQSLVITEGTLNVADSVVCTKTGVDAVQVQGKDVKVTVTNSDLGSAKKDDPKSGKINITGTNPTVTVSDSTVVGDVTAANTAKEAVVTLSDTEVTGSVSVAAVGAKLDVTGGSVVSETTKTPAVSVTAYTKVAEDAVEVSLNNVTVKAPDDAVAVYLVSAGTYTVTGSKVVGGSGIQALNGTVDVKSTDIEATAKTSVTSYTDPAGHSTNDGCAITLITANTPNIGNDVFPALTLNVDSASKLTVAQNGGEKIKFHVLNVGATDVAINATGYEINKNHDISIVGDTTKLALKHKDPVNEVVLTINGEVYEAE